MSAVRYLYTIMEKKGELIFRAKGFVQELGCEPTSEEIARKMDYPINKVLKILKIAQKPISLETQIGEIEDYNYLGDFFEDRGTKWAVSTP